MLSAYLLLPHRALDAPDGQVAIKKHNTSLRLPSIPQRQHILRGMLWQDAIQRLKERPRQRGLARNN